MISGGAGNYLNELAIFQYSGKGDKETAQRNDLPHFYRA
jgi:hypothetical protein